MKLICEICKKVNITPDCNNCQNNENREKFFNELKKEFKDALNIELVDLENQPFEELLELLITEIRYKYKIRSEQRISLPKFEHTNKFLRAINKKHDYANIYNSFLKANKAISNSNTKTLDAASNYANNFVLTSAVNEGLHFLFKFPWNIISKVFGASKYHQNVLDSINIYAENLDGELQLKQDKIQKVSPKIGFTIK